MIFTCTITNISLTCCGRLDEKFQKNLNDMSQSVAPFCPPKNGWDSWLFIPPVMGYQPESIVIHQPEIKVHLRGFILATNQHFK